MHRFQFRQIRRMLPHACRGLRMAGLLILCSIVLVVPQAKVRVVESSHLELIPADSSESTESSEISLAALCERSSAGRRRKCEQCSVDEPVLAGRQDRQFACGLFLIGDRGLAHRLAPLRC